MPFHHLALATRNLDATHRFYTEAMGFELAKVVAGKTPEGGWAKHVFYRAGGGELMAFWELHDESLPQDFEPGIADAAGLPKWVNHVAFRADGVDDLHARLQRWLDFGVDASEVDHGWCRSIYTLDPNGTLVEFCTDTAVLDESDAAEAARLLTDPSPELEPPGQVTIHRAPR
ncbi:MAG: VOC family protein [Myxococcota bacterium]|nr:VOC family protein [Myxococcota bacterium]